MPKFTAINATEHDENTWRTLTLTLSHSETLPGGGDPDGHFLANERQEG